MPIKISSAKAKGRALQKYVGAYIASIFEVEFGKDEDIASRPMGQSGTDVIIHKSIFDRFPFCIECKAQETWSIPAWIEQAKKNIYKNGTWLLVVKRSRKQPVVIMDVDIFFDLIKRIKKYEDQSYDSTASDTKLPKSQTN